MTCNIFVTLRALFVCGMLIFITAIIAGCTPVHKEKGITPYYKSLVDHEQPNTKKLGTIHISAIKEDEPFASINPKTCPIRYIFYFTPLLSAIPLSDLTIKNKGLLGEGDIEEILASEIMKTGMFDEALSQGVQGDYAVKERVNFTIDRYDHNSGLGIIYFSLIPMIFLPSMTDHYTCEAHFEMISVKDGKIVLSKDYKAAADKNKRFISS